MAQKHHIASLLEYLKINVSKFERETGVGASTISKAIDRNTALGFGTVQKILDKYPQVSKTWLETGEGEMIVRETEGGKPKSYIDQLLEAKDEVAHLYKTMAMREREISDRVLSNFDKFYTEIEQIKGWKKEVSSSILDLSKRIAPLLATDQSRLGVGVGSKKGSS